MALQPLPFLTDPASSQDATTAFQSHEPTGQLASICQLSKVQLALWLDYLRRPSSSHYLLTLKVDIFRDDLSLDKLVQVIHNLGSQHPMLRTTFHIDSDVDDYSNSYMAVHDASSAAQDIQVAVDETKLLESLRKPFNLSIQFPVRWVVLMRLLPDAAGTVQPRYSLYVTGHHIAVDGFSMSRLSKELLENLAAETVALPPTTLLPYGEYVHRQEAYLRSPNGWAAKEFWISQMRHTLPLQWMVPKPRSRDPNYRNLDTWSFFSNDELKAWSELYKTSWFRVATSIIGLLIASISAPIAHHDYTLMTAFGARAKEFEQCVSHMANTMPVKFPLSSLLRNGASFADAVKAMGRNLSTAKKHEMFPLMSLMEEVQKTMSPDILDFKVAVTFSPKPANESCTLFPVTGVWDLFFCFLEHDDGVSLGVIHNPEVFSSETLKQLRSTFENIFALSTSRPSFALTELPFLQNRTPAQLISGPAITDVDSISNSRVHQWIKARAASQRSVVALSSAEQNVQMTYGELADKSSQVAHFLQQRGVGKDDAVLIHLERGFEQVVWILGVLEAGACYVVVDKAWPAARKEAVTSVIQAKAAVHDTEALGFSLPAETIAINLSQCTAEVAMMPKTPVECSISNNDLAYVIFTSGSTGRPKGVMVEHANLSHYVSSARGVVRIGPHSRVLQFASFAFDAVVIEYAVTLAYGGTLCFADHPQMLVGDYLADIIQRNGVNFFHCTPSVLSTISVERCLPSLRMVSLGGEAPPSALLGQWRKKVELLHAYGPTEATVICTVEHLAKDDNPSRPCPNASVIGDMSPNCRVLICEEGSLEPLPAGTMGEICIAGPQVARGYLGQEELTHSKFCTVALPEGGAMRLYRSGDKGCVNAAGKLSIQGRIGNREIKLRGYRIDLHEIERSILAQNPEVTMVSVQQLGDSLIGLVVSASVDGEQVRARLQEDTPRYAVPTRILAISILPLNSNGKIDHAQATEVAEHLMEPEAGTKMDTPSASYVSMSASVEGLFRDPAKVGKDQERLCSYLTDEVSNLWSQLLGPLNSLGPDVGFFEAGGHSILLVKLHNLIKERFGTGSRLSLVDIFSAPTIRAQAERLLPLVSLESPLISTVGSESAASKSTPVSNFSASISSTATSLDNLDVAIGTGDDRARFAIVGMSGRYPRASNPKQLWDVVKEQREGLTSFTKPVTLPFAVDKDSIFVQRYGVIDGLNDFQPARYHLSEAEAAALDPQKRLFLDVASEALADAGMAPPRSTQTSHIGVFVGASPNTFLCANRCHDATAAAGSVPQSFGNHYPHLLDCPIATLAAYKLNLTGPNIILSTACSSALSALWLACAALAQGNCCSAVVGGASIVFPQEGGYLTAGPVAAGRSAALFSPSGVCRPLDARADGCVPADGVGAIVLKPLSDARAAGDAVYAVIEGVAIGSDGAIDKAGIGVPSASGQSRTVEASLRRAGPAAQAHLRYIEMHGSGTPWGDALEVQGLKMAFASLDKNPAKQQGLAAQKRPTPAKILLGSNKGNFGNAEAASGLLSLMKASQALARGVVPPLRDLATPNEACGFEDSRFEPLVKSLDLQPEDRVGVTSLGYGGSNAHIVLASALAFGLTEKTI